jgi:hypothetical protein
MPVIGATYWLKLWAAMPLAVATAGMTMIEATIANNTQLRTFVLRSDWVMASMACCDSSCCCLPLASFMLSSCRKLYSNSPFAVVLRTPSGRPARRFRHARLRRKCPLLGRVRFVADAPRLVKAEGGGSLTRFRCPSVYMADHTEAEARLTAPGGLEPPAPALRERRSAGELQRRV